MTVGELIERLEQFSKDKEVKIGMNQDYGSDFVMNIRDVDECMFDDFDDGNTTAVVITEGRQIGTLDIDE